MSILEMFFLSWCIPVFRLSIPLIWASLGALWCERSGVVQLGLEGYLLLGAFFGAATTYYFHQPFLGFLAGGFAGLIWSSVFALFVLRFRSNQIVAATALNLAAMGLVPLSSKFFFDSTSTTPPLIESSQWFIFPWLSVVVLMAVSHFFFYRTRFGLRLRFAGEHPEALKSAGISVGLKRLQGIWISGFLGGVGGVMLSTFLSSSFTRNMSGGRGYIALAALILGRWKPIPTAMACFLFGLSEVIQIRLQGMVLWGQDPVPTQWVQLFPYALTLVILFWSARRSEAPKFLGTDL